MKPIININPKCLKWVNMCGGKTKADSAWRVWTTCCAFNVNNEVIWQ